MLAKVLLSVGYIVVGWATTPLDYRSDLRSAHLAQTSTQRTLTQDPTHQIYISLSYPSTEAMPTPKKHTTIRLILHLSFILCLMPMFPGSSNILPLIYFSQTHLDPNACLVRRYNLSDYHDMMNYRQRNVQCSYSSLKTKLSTTPSTDCFPLCSLKSRLHCTNNIRSALSNKLDTGN